MPKRVFNPDEYMDDFKQPVEKIKKKSPKFIDPDEGAASKSIRHYRSQTNPHPNRSYNPTPIHRNKP